MDVYIKKVKSFEINNVKELETYIKEYEVRKNFKEFPKFIRDRVLNDIQSKLRINLKELKTTFLKKYFTEGSCFKTKYWLERGYSEYEAVEIISKQQRNRTNKFHTKRKNNPENYIGWNCKQVEYWIQRGYSEKEAEEIISKNQHTFSKDKLLDKYDEEIANKILNKRNKKWFNSLKKNNDWSVLSKKKGSGLNQIKTLTRHIEYYGEKLGKIKFAKRYWGIDINSIEEFDEYDKFIQRERTVLFYDKHYRELILEDQNSKCGECGTRNTDTLFHLHHIDYNKLNDNRKNLIFLCHSCHSKTTNSDRRKWIKYYKHKNKKYYE